MKLLVFLIFFLLSPTACADGFGDVLAVDAELQPYLSRFIKEAEARYKIPFVINNLTLRTYPSNVFDSNDTIAQCVYTETPQIQVRADWFNLAQDSAREQVIFHELGHCILNIRTHNNAWIVYQNDTIPQSIMNANLFSDYYYDKFKTYYLDQLFGRSK